MRVVRSFQSPRAVLRLLAGLVIGGTCACKREEASVPPVRPVLVATVVRQDARLFGPFTGTVEPRYRTDQGFRTSGRMLTRRADVGDLVHEGERLATLDDTLLKFAVTGAEAGVADAAARASRAKLADDRKRALIKTGAVPQSEADSAAADAKTAAAKLDQAKATLQKMRDQLGFAILAAAYDGVVLAWKAEVGQDVAEGQAVVTIARPDVREAVIDVPENLVADVKAKATFDVKLQSADDLHAEGVVREIAPSADDVTRTRRIRFTLRSPPEAFRIGSTVSVSLTRPVPSRILVPEAALVHRDGADAVWVVPKDDDRVASRRVSVVDRRQGEATVDGEIDPSERVVVAGVHELKPGERVRTITRFP